MVRFYKKFVPVTLVFLSLSISQPVSACGMQALELLIPIYVGGAITFPVWGPFYLGYKAVKSIHKAKIAGESDHLFRIQDSRLKSLSVNEQDVMRKMKEFFYFIAKEHSDSPILWEGVPAELKQKWQKSPEYLVLSKIEALFAKDKIKAATLWATAKPFFKAATSKHPNELSPTEQTKLRMINIQKQLISSSEGNLARYKDSVLDMLAVVTAIKKKEILTDEASKIKNLLFVDIEPSDELCDELIAYITDVILVTVDIELSGVVIKQFKRTVHANAGVDTLVGQQS